MVTLSSEVCCDGFRQAESSVSNRETFQNETPMEIYRDILCAVVLVELRAIALLMPPTLARLASIFSARTRAVVAYYSMIVSVC